MDASFEILQRAAELRSRRVPFVLATVIVSRKPTSASAGSRAIITHDGALIGWIGGACSQPSVVRHALEALASGETRVIRLSPDAGTPSRDGVVDLQMTCHSGGTLEIFLEPFVPQPQLVVVGTSPVAQTIVEIGERFDFTVVAAASADDMPQSTDVLAPYIVVATMGVEDEAALEQALVLEPTYLGMVSSRRRFSELADYLRARGVAQDALAAIHAPAGLDLGARTPQEIALSILAEIVQHRHTTAPTPQPASIAAGDEQLVVDPICGMTVDLRTTRHTLVIDGTTYGFCCPACRRTFQQQRTAD